MFDLPAHIKHDTDEKLKQILKKAVLSQNGEVSRLMHRMGIKSRLNYGVPVITLRQIAQEFLPDHQLAMKLWQEDIREAKILASMLTEPAKLGEEDLLTIARFTDSIEFAELFGRDIFGYKISSELIDQMIGGTIYQQVSVLYAMGWAIKRLNQNFEIACNWLEKSLDSTVINEINELRQPVLFAMQACGQMDADHAALMCRVAVDLSASDNNLAKRIGSEYQWLCEGSSFS